MTITYLETERFIIRQWKPEDAEQLFNVMSDSRVHIFTGDETWTRERTEGYIRFILEKNFRTMELFHAACVLKDSGVIIGLTGLNPYLPNEPELEWQFGVPHWGKGYATEIGRAVIRKAFETTGLAGIYAMANPENKGSMRALEKIGMTRLGLRDFRGEQDMFFYIQREEVLPAAGD